MSGNWRVYILSLSIFIPNCQGVRLMILWVGNWLRQSFLMCAFIIYIYFFSGPLNASFPWKSIWCIKAPKRVSFLLWTTVWDRILTIDNLVKRGLSLINWCCLCRCNGDIVDHLLLHCKFAHTLWTVEWNFYFLFFMFGIQWVMLKEVASLLFTWRNWLGKQFSNIWNMVPACLMWKIWRVCNTHTFEDIERPLDLLKSLLVGTLFEWSRIWVYTSCTSISDFLESVNIK